MVLMPMEGRNFDNPKRGVLDRDDQERPESRDPERPGTTDRGQRDSDSVYDRESKVMRARPLVDPTPGCSRSGSPSQINRFIYKWS
jgi:hypothetical protein